MPLRDLAIAGNTSANDTYSVGRSSNVNSAYDDAAAGRDVREVSLEPTGANSSKPWLSVPSSHHCYIATGTTYTAHSMHIVNTLDSGVTGTMVAYIRASFQRPHPRFPQPYRGSGEMSRRYPARRFHRAPYNRFARRRLPLNAGFVQLERLTSLPYEGLR